MIHDREYICVSSLWEGIELIPTQELVRCKECIYYDGYYCHNKNWGDGYGNYTPPIKAEDGFCDWGNRKGDNYETNR